MTGKKTSNKSRASTKTQAAPPWLLLSVGLLIGLLIAALFFLRMQPRSEALHQGEKGKVQQAESNHGQHRPHFDFYTMLPKGIVEIKSTQTQRTIKVPPLKSKNQPSHSPYGLQVASFNHLEEADRLRAKLLLEGFSVSIRKAKVNDRTVYRVVVGPFNKPKEAGETRQQLAELQLESMLTTVG